MNPQPFKTQTPHALASELIKQAGVRLTQQRQAVLEVILASHDHPTASAIYERIRLTHEGVSLATVYNCLDTMSQAGIINQLHFDNGSSRYCPNQVPHAHLVDEQSNQVIDVRLKPGVRLEEVFDLPPGVQVRHLSIYLRGEISTPCFSKESK